MSRHPYALNITLLIMAEERYAGSLPDAAYQVLAHSVDLAGYTEERRADLYSRIAECLAPGDSMTTKQRKIDDALRANDQEFATA